MIKPQIKDIIVKLDEFYDKHRDLNALDKQDIEDLNMVYDLVRYLAKSLFVSESFLQAINSGDLNYKHGEKAYLDGHFKELVSILKHLTWQANQVASGDYSQKVDFLGEFSIAFNQMITQLEEREVELKKQSLAINQTVDLLTSIIETNNRLVIVTDAADNSIIYSNKDVENQIATYQIGLNGMGNASFISKHSEKVLANNEVFTGIYLSSVDNHYYSISSHPIIWNNKKSVAHYISDVTNEALEKRYLSDYAYKDDLTGTYNRRYSTIKINEYLSNKEEFTLIAIDIDNLKYVNDNYGHVEGDKYLVDVVNTIYQNIKSSDYIFRVGGDEFVILLEDCSSQNAKAKMDIIYQKIKQSSQKYLMSISYGLVHVDETNEHSYKDLLHECDQKMYSFKEKHKFTPEQTNNFCLVSEKPTIQDIMINPIVNFELKHAYLDNSINDDLLQLRKAIANNEFIVYLQPQVELATSDVYGAEALIRKYDENFKISFPHEFIDKYERSGIISEIDIFVLEEACKYLNVYNDILPINFTISINFSRHTIVKDNIVDTLLHILAKYEVSPNQITLEITERSHIIDKEFLFSRAKLLCELGFKLSLDDFGTGYSNLETICAIDFTEIKFDKSLIARLLKAPKTKLILSRIIDSFVPENSNVYFIAEGIETTEQYKLLKEMGCQRGQGYYFGKPTPILEFYDKFIKKVSVI